MSSHPPRKPQQVYRDCQSATNLALRITTKLSSTALTVRDDDAFGDADLWHSGIRHGIDKDVYVEICGRNLHFVGAYRDNLPMMTILSMRGTVTADETITETNAVKRFDELIRDVLVEGLNTKNHEELRLLSRQNRDLSDQFRQFNQGFLRLRDMSKRSKTWKRTNVLDGEFRQTRIFGTWFFSRTQPFYQ